MVHLTYPYYLFQIYKPLAKAPGFQLRNNFTSFSFCFINLSKFKPDNLQYLNNSVWLKAGPLQC